MDPAPLLGPGWPVSPSLSLFLQIDVVMKPGWLAKLSLFFFPPFFLPVSFPSSFSKAPGLSMTGHPLLLLPSCSLPLLSLLLSFFICSAQTLSSPPFTLSQTFK